jgi:hypothetical protein
MDVLRNPELLRDVTESIFVKREQNTIYDKLF